MSGEQRDAAWAEELPIIEKYQDEEGTYWVRCPRCGSLGTVDKDQYNGDTSIVCAPREGVDGETCGDHYTLPKR